MEQQTLPSPGPDMTGMGPAYFFVGLSNRFNNRFQALADRMFQQLSWKQIFFLNCITLFPQPPTIRDLAELMGCSHQNAKQLLTRLERAGFVTLRQDPSDRRKQRIALTAEAEQYRKTYDQPSQAAMEALFRGVDRRELETAIHVLQQLDNNLNTMQEEDL